MEMWLLVGLIVLLTVLRQPVLVLLGCGAIGLGSRWRRLDCRWCLAALALGAAYWGSGLFNYSLWAPWWQTSYMLLTAICVGASLAEHPDAAGERSV